MKIVQLVPRLPPEMCGVGDYSLALARELRAYGIETSFLICNPHSTAGSETEGFNVNHLSEHSPLALRQALRRLDFDAVVVQYSGYGFAKRGAPTWLPLGLRTEKRPIATMFHELYATSRLVSSAFWLSPLMKWTARRLAKLSQWRVTNRQASAEWLKLPTSVLPIFSSMGELKTKTSINDRPNRLAIFAYQAALNPNYWRRLRLVMSELKPDSVVCLGKRVSGVVENIGTTIRVEETGVLPPDAVSAKLRNCRFGFLSYFPEHLAKSGILAAFAAHELCVVFAGTRLSALDGLVIGENIAAFDRPEVCDWTKTASNLAQWYARHDLATTAATYADALRQLCRVQPPSN